MVLRMDVHISVPPSFEASEIKVIRHFMSWRTTCVFVERQAWSEIDPNDIEVTQLIRKAVASIVPYVNNNGGWSMVGWLRTGNTKDASDATATGEDIASINQAPHISYLCPYRTSLIREPPPEFQYLRLTEKDLDQLKQDRINKATDNVSGVEDKQDEEEDDVITTGPRSKKRVYIQDDTTDQNTANNTSKKAKTSSKQPTLTHAASVTKPSTRNSAS